MEDFRERKGVREGGVCCVNGCIVLLCLKGFSGREIGEREAEEKWGWQRIEGNGRGVSCRAVGRIVDRGKVVLCATASGIFLVLAVV